MALIRVRALEYAWMARSFRAAALRWMWTVTATRLATPRFRLALIAAHDDRDALRAVYLFTAAAPDRRVELYLPIDRHPTHRAEPGRAVVPASRFEREMHDLYGVQPPGPPAARRPVRHRHWPSGWYPMRHDTGTPPAFADAGHTKARSTTSWPTPVLLPGLHRP
jgi:Ni,Fe-hydrogenase III component G